MLKALVVIVVVIALLLLIGAVMAGAGSGARAEVPMPRPRPKERVSPNADTALFLLALLALVVAITLGARFGDGWWVIPIAAWVVVFRAVRADASRRRHAEQRKIRQQAEAQQRHALRRRQRIEEFGQEGLKLLDEADAAVERIMSTEAARTGWLGRLDFSADHAAIADILRKATTIRNVMAESWAIPNRSEVDTKMMKDARRALNELDSSARQRVMLLSNCAEEATQIDRILRDDREKQRAALQRDEVRSRLNALLYGIELTSSSTPSDSVDALKARVGAFHELRSLMVKEHSMSDAAEEGPQQTTPAKRTSDSLWRRIGR